MKFEKNDAVRVKNPDNQWFDHLGIVQELHFDEREYACTVLLNKHRVLLTMFMWDELEYADPTVCGLRKTNPKTPVVLDGVRDKVVGFGYVTEDEITLKIDSKLVVKGVGRGLQVGDIQQFMLGLYWIPAEQGLVKVDPKPAAWGVEQHNQAVDQEEIDGQ